MDTVSLRSVCRVHQGSVATYPALAWEYSALIFTEGWTVHFASVYSTFLCSCLLFWVISTLGNIRRLSFFFLYQSPPHFEYFVWKSITILQNQIFYSPCWVILMYFRTLGKYHQIPRAFFFCYCCIDICNSLF